MHGTFFAPCVLRLGVGKVSSVSLKSIQRACVTVDRPQGYHCGLELKAIILFPSEPQARPEHQKPDHPTNSASF